MRQRLNVGQPGEVPSYPRSVEVGVHARIAGPRTGRARTACVTGQYVAGKPWNWSRLCRASGGGHRQARAEAPVVIASAARVDVSKVR